MSGVYTQTLFDLEIIEASEFEGPNTDPVNLNINNWDIFPHLIGNPHDPVLRMQQQGELDDNTVTISILIDDSPKLSRLEKTITYDPDIFPIITMTYLIFLIQTIYDLYPQSYDSDG